MKKIDLILTQDKTYQGCQRVFQGRGQVAGDGGGVEGKIPQAMPRWDLSTEAQCREGECLSESGNQKEGAEPGK